MPPETQATPDPAPEAPKPKPKGVGRFFGDFKTKVWAGVIALLVTGTLTQGEAIMSWIGQTTADALRGMVETVVTETLADDLDGGDGLINTAVDTRIDGALEPGGAISAAFRARADEAIEQQIGQALADGGSIALSMGERIDEALNGRVGAAMAGGILLDADNFSRTLHFYVPTEHQVDLSLRVEGLAENEILRVQAFDSRGLVSFFDFESDGLRDVSELRRSAEDRTEGVRGPTISDPTADDHRISNIMPLIMTLRRPDNVLISEAEVGGQTDRLRSKAKVEFVALLTPPLKKDQ